MLTIGMFREQNQLIGKLFAEGTRQANYFVEHMKEKTQTLNVGLSMIMQKNFSPLLGVAKKANEELRMIKAELKDVDKQAQAIEIVGKVDKALEATKKLVNDFNSVVTISIGSDFKDLNKEMQEAFRERALYAAKGKTDQQIQAFDEMTREIVKINPYLQSTDAMKLISASEQLQQDPEEAKAFAKQAAQLGVTTSVAPKELLSMMNTMSQLTGSKDAELLADSIQFMNNSLQAFSGKELEAIIAYSKENDLKLDSPEKLATLVVELDKQGITGIKTETSTEQIKQTAEKVASGEIRTQVGNEASTAYNRAMEHNPFLEFQQAQKDARQAFMELGMTVARDVLPVLKPMIEGFKTLAETLNGLPQWARTFLEIEAGKAILGLAVFKIIRFASEIKQLFGGEGAATTAPACVPCTPTGNMKGGNRQRRTKYRNQNNQGNKKTSHTSKGSWLKNLGQNLKNNSVTKHIMDMIGMSSKPSGLDRHSFIGSSPISVANAPNHLPSLKLAGGSSLLRKIPVLRTFMGAADIAQSDNKLETAARIGAEALGGWGGAAAGAALGATVGSVIPVVGTVVGGAVGGILGGIGGAEVGGMLFDKVKDWWQGEEKPASTPPPEQHMSPVPLGPPAPVGAPVSGMPEKAGAISLTIPQISVPLHVEGVLQDIPTMLNMLNDPSVGQRIKLIIEKALLDSLETRGGVAT